MKQRTSTATSFFLVTTLAGPCLAEPQPAIAMQQIMDDLRAKWRLLDDGFGYSGETFEINYLAGTFNPATGGSSDIHVAAVPTESRSQALVESSGAIYAVHEAFRNGNSQRYHFGRNAVFFLVDNDRVGNYERRTTQYEFQVIGLPVFTPARLWSDWLEYPWPSRFVMRPDPTRQITRKVTSATNDEIVEEVECARIDKEGKRVAEHHEFVAKPVKDLGWLPVEVRDVHDGHVQRSSKITWAAIKIGDKSVPIPEKIEIESEALDPATKGWLKGSSLGLKIDMATFITPSTVKDGKRPWLDVEAREGKLTAELPPAPKAPDLTN